MNKLLFKRIAVSVFFVVLLVFILGLVLPLLIKPSFVQSFLVEAVAQHTDYSLSLEDPKFKLFPSPSFGFKNVKLWNRSQASDPVPLVSADSVACRLYVLPLLLKRVEFKTITAGGMRLSVPLNAPPDSQLAPVEIKDAALTLHDVRSGKWSKFQLRGKWLGSFPNVELAGKFKVNYGETDLRRAAFSGELKLSKVSLVDLFSNLGLSASATPASGTLGMVVEVSKQASSSSVSANAKAKVDDFIYRAGANSSPGDKSVQYEISLDSNLNLENKVVTLQNISLTTPFGIFSGKGAFDAAARKLEEVQIGSDSVVLDNLPSHLPWLTQILPAGLGFSGEGKMSFHASGGMDQVFLNAKLDLTKALLSYSRYFTKPKEMPFFITTDELAIKQQRELNGSVDVQFGTIKIKGALVKFDIISKTGEMTLVSNLIPLQGLNQYLPTFAGYDFSGTAKFFANGKGDFEKPGKMILMYHFAFNDTNAKASSEPPLFQNLNGSIDGGPFDFETKDFRFDLNKTHFDVNVKMSFQGGPRLAVEVRSPDLDLRDLVLHVEKILKVLGIQQNAFDLAGVERAVDQLVQPGSTLQNFSARIEYEKDRLIVDQLAFEIYGGRFKSTGFLDLTDKTAPPFHLNGEIENMSLARMFRRDIATPVEGNLFAVLEAEGKGFSKEALQANLKGGGTVSVTNGEFRTFDVLGSLGAIAEFAGLGQFVSGTTRFSDVNGKLEIGGGKIKTDHILIYSDDFDVDAAGELTFDGNLNFRLDTVLSNHLSRKINSRIEEGNRMGPIPLLLTGSVSSPSLRPDPAFIRDFLMSFAAGKISKILAGQNWLQKLSPAFSDEAAQSDETGPVSGQTPSNDAASAGMLLLESLFQKE